MDSTRSRGEAATEMTELRYDEEATNRLLAVYVTPDVVAQRAQFLHALGPQAGERVLDVGSGPGFLAAAIAEAVGSSGTVHCAHQSWVEFRRADATQLPFSDHAFDAVISTQVLEYIRDVDAALAEVHCVVSRTGLAIIVDTDWDSIVWYSPDRERMNRL